MVCIYLKYTWPGLKSYAAAHSFRVCFLQGAKETGGKQMLLNTRGEAVVVICAFWLALEACMCYNVSRRMNY
jgi:hypothetical protein